MALKEHVIREIEELNARQLEEVENYLAFLKFRSRIEAPPVFNAVEVAGLYREFGQEDAGMAEEGMADYARDLAREDGK
jgi:hypothetical protein